MNTRGSRPGIGCTGIDHLHFYVQDALAWGGWLHRVWGFRIQGKKTSSDTLSLWLSQGSIRLILSQPLHRQGPVADYLQSHPQGVADVALQITDAARAYDFLRSQHQSVSWQAQGSLNHLHLHLPIPPGTPARHRMDLRHSLIERIPPPDPSGELPPLPGFVPLPTSEPDPEPCFSHIDHVVINLPQQALLPMADWYAHLFDWQPLYRFTVTTADSGLNSIVMGPTSPLVAPLLIALNEPLEPASQIQEFMEANGGPGVQHVALHTSDILRTVPRLQQQGVAFLPIPKAYYQALPTDLLGDLPQRLAAHQILVDRVSASSQAHPADPLLLQIFSQPLFPEPTFFFEIIQRRAHAQGFGEANFQALFEAIERQQHQRSPSAPPDLSQTSGSN